MVKLTSLALAMAAGQVVAAPSHVGKRQSFADILPLLTGKGYKLMGDPKATKTFISLTKLLGASKTSAGGVPGWMAGPMNAGYGLTTLDQAETAVVAPSRTNSTSPLGIEGAKRVKIRYGPYKVPSMKHKNLLGEEGMLSNYPHQKMEKPCAGECTVIGMQAGLEYVDGRNANIDTGLWLHHMVLFNKGPDRRDPTCKDEDISLPHATIGGTPRTSERIFASGNERGFANLPGWGHKDVGYKMKPTDEVAALLELMNENMEDKKVYLTITWDYLDGHPYKDEVKVVWFDVRQCGTSEVSPPPKQDKYDLTYDWKSNIDGTIIGAIGHLHDGGYSLTLDRDGEKTCENPAYYGTKPDFIQQAEGGHGHGGATKHISDMPPCYGEGFPHKEMRAGQNWRLKAYYDYAANPGQKHEDGDWDEVMGISIMYLRLKKGYRFE